MKHIALILSIILVITAIASISVWATNTAESDDIKIQKGTYIGDSFDPQTLTFDFVPAIIIVETPAPRTDGLPGWFNGFVWTGEASLRATSSTYPEYDDAEFYFTTNGKSITFTVGGYQPGGDYYLNEDGVEYSYIAIGY